MPHVVEDYWTNRSKKSIPNSIIVTQIITSTARTRFITLAGTEFSAANSGQPRTTPTKEQRKK